MKKIKTVLVVLAWSVILALIGVNTQEFWQQTNCPYRGSLPSIAIAFSGHVFAATNIGIFWSALSTTEKKENEKELTSVLKLPLIAHNYPNPFNSSTIICFIFTQILAKFVTNLSVYNIQGKKIIQLIEERLPAGNHLTHWNGINDTSAKLASRVYLYELRVGDKRFISKMNLLK